MQTRSCLLKFFKWYIQIMFHKFARGVTHFDVFGTTAHMLDVYSTSRFPGGWARINENDNIDNFDDLKFVTPLDCSRSVGHYFPSDISSWHSGVVHAVAEGFPCERWSPSVPGAP
ncbi:unnamed protein product [Phytophthora lilii]|uniref:Unnamed protein product n=1 Tax=Phytophthora lilii TaxID=2077276 RepID=A0A9W6TSX2_9STRA|nr:unnamed protein product [Phytophthora lilii]